MKKIEEKIETIVRELAFLDKRVRDLEKKLK